jgi:hypothetical protein
MPKSDKLPDLPAPGVRFQASPISRIHSERAPYRGASVERAASLHPGLLRASRSSIVHFLVVAFEHRDRNQPFASAPAAHPGSDAWRDYEHAKRIGTKEVWELFLRSHPTGFAADVAKGELDKLLSSPPPHRP